MTYSCHSYFVILKTNKKKDVNYMNDIYETCPVLEDHQYTLRFVKGSDAADLLKVYSDRKAVQFFNSDNCHGENFYYQTLEKMQNAIKYWIFEYERKGFVRWSILDKNRNEAIGTIELFNRKSEDDFNDCGILRLDLRSNYETQDCIFNILTIITLPAFSLFNCSIIATKAIPDAIERISALKKIGFVKSEKQLIGNDGTAYSHYWIYQKK